MSFVLVATFLITGSSAFVYPRATSTSTFGVTTTLHHATTRTTTACLMSSDSNDEGSGLLLDSEKMAKSLEEMQRKLPTSEAAYLMESRKRAEEARASVNSQASDSDWEDMKENKRREMGGEVIDDWEAALSEAGNEDSIGAGLLIETFPEDGEEEEPKLII